jgi:hypothetical protein
LNVSKVPIIDVWPAQVSQKRAQATGGSFYSVSKPAIRNYAGQVHRIREAVWKVYGRILVNAGAPSAGGVGHHALVFNSVGGGGGSRLTLRVGFEFPSSL